MPVLSVGAKQDEGFDTAVRGFVDSLDFYGYLGLTDPNRAQELFFLFGPKFEVFDAAALKATFGDSVDPKKFSERFAGVAYRSPLVFDPEFSKTARALPDRKAVADPKAKNSDWMFLCPGCADRLKVKTADTAENKTVPPPMPALNLRYKIEYPCASTLAATVSEINMLLEKHGLRVSSSNGTRAVRVFIQAEK
jgi:hypothetical protein